MDRPRIGVTTSLNPTDSGAREQRLDLNYVRAVERAGGLPLIVPMLATDEAAEAFAALLDGLVVTGGPAVTDGLVGELPDDIDETDPDRRRALTRELQRARTARGFEHEAVPREGDSRMVCRAATPGNGFHVRVVDHTNQDTMRNNPPGELVSRLPFFVYHETG